MFDSKKRRQDKAFYDGDISGCGWHIERSILERKEQDGP